MTRRGFLGLASCLPFLGFAKAVEHPKSKIDESKCEAHRLNQRHAEASRLADAWVAAHPPASGTFLDGKVLWQGLRPDGQIGSVGWAGCRDEKQFFRMHESARRSFWVTAYDHYYKVLG